MKCLWCEKEIKINQKDFDGMHSKCIGDFKMTLITMAKVYREATKKESENKCPL